MLDKIQTTSLEIEPTVEKLRKVKFLNFRF